MPTPTPNPFAHAVACELARAKAKYAPLNSHHEAYAVMLEELDEYWQEVKRWPLSHDTAKMRAELVQIAAMAQRAAEDLNLKE